MAKYELNRTYELIDEDGDKLRFKILKFESSTVDVSVTHVNDKELYSQDGLTKLEECETWLYFSELEASTEYKPK